MQAFLSSLSDMIVEYSDRGKESIILRLRRVIEIEAASDNSDDIRHRMQISRLSVYGEYTLRSDGVSRRENPASAAV